MILAFYPMDWEPVSREQLTLYQSYLDAFDCLSARLFGISVDSVHCHQAFARDAQIGLRKSGFHTMHCDAPLGRTDRRRPYSGMLSCFFQGFCRSLLRRSLSALATRRRVECGMITSSI